MLLNITQALLNITQVLLDTTQVKGTGAFQSNGRCVGASHLHNRVVVVLPALADIARQAYHPTLVCLTCIVAHELRVVALRRHVCRPDAKAILLLLLVLEGCVMTFAGRTRAPLATSRDFIKFAGGLRVRNAA